MHYAKSGTGPETVFLHGIASDGRLWNDVVSSVSAELTCIVVELLGQGGVPSDGDYRLSFDRCVRELEELRETLGHAEWNLVGHDIGSTMAVLYAGAHPDRVRSLCICSGPVVPDFRPPAIFRPLRMAGLGDCIGPFAVPLIWRFAIPLAFKRRDAAARRAVAEFRAPFRGWRGSRGFVQLLRWGDPKDVMGRTRRILMSLDCPVLVIHGRNDPAIPLRFAAEAASLAPRGALEVMDARHFLPIDEPALLSEHLQSFLRKRHAVDRGRHALSSGG